MRERGEMLAGVKSWGELGLGPWRSWAVDGPREACWAMLSLPHSSFISETENSKEEHERRKGWRRNLGKGLIFLDSQKCAQSMKNRSGHD